MTEVKRSYDASGRRSRRRARRLAVVLAARDLFERDGFRPTTITAVAARAGVSAGEHLQGLRQQGRAGQGGLRPRDRRRRRTGAGRANARRCRRCATSPTSGARSRCSSTAWRNGRRARRRCRSSSATAGTSTTALGPDLGDAERRGPGRHDDARPPPARDRPAPRRDRPRRGARRAVELPRDRQLRTAGPLPRLAARAVHPHWLARAISNAICP